MELLWFNLSSFISSFFTCYIIKSFLVIKGKKWRSVILYIACFFLNGMIIYIGDPANMPPTFLLFVGALFLCCEGSAKKKLTLGITLSCAPFALNCLIDSFIRDFHYTTANLAVQFTKVLFWVLLWLFIRKLRHDMNNHLQVLSQLPEQEVHVYINGLLKDSSIGKPMHP